MGKICPICKVVLLLLVIGGLNWGLYGALHKDIVRHFLGDWTRAARIVYLIIGLASIPPILKLVGVKCPACKE